MASLPAHVVFAQVEGAAVPVEAIAGQIAAQLGARMTTLPAAVARASAARVLEPVLRVEVVAGAERGAFVLGARPVTSEDVECARQAEQRGRAAGMGALASRCRTVWTIEGEAGAPEWILLELCALLAFAGLGPVLPPDGSTLLGVRSARERAARLRAGG